MTTQQLVASPVIGADEVAGATQDGPPVQRVVLIDPREARRAIMSYFVKQSPLLTVVGLAATLAEASALIASEQAQVALVEIQMPLAEGLATIAALRAEFPDLRIVVCSFLNDPATQESARASGADGYLSKPPSLMDLRMLVSGPPSDAVATSPIPG